MEFFISTIFLCHLSPTESAEGGKLGSKPYSLLAVRLAQLFNLDPKASQP